MMIKLKVYNSDGDDYIVPAQLVETKFKDHQFAVHKSIFLGDNDWSISHVGTGLSVVKEPSRERAIEALELRLKGLNLTKMRALVKAGIENRNQIIAANRASADELALAEFRAG